MLVKLPHKLKLLGNVSLAVLLIGASSLYAQAEALSEDAELEEVVVTGIRGSLQSAATRKQDSKSFLDSIVAEDMGKFPDQNVAEALQRITGVSISRINGEGTQVTVRGFGPEFNLVKLNGRTLASALPGRDFDFQVISSDLISGADIIKTPEASTTEGSIGALVDLQTARPLDHTGFALTLVGRGSYNSLAGGVKPEFSAIVRNTFADDSMGIVFGVSYQKGENRIDQTGGTRSSLFDATGRTDVVDTDGNSISVGQVRYPGRWEFNLIEEERDRLGFIGAFQWQVDDNIRITMDGLYTDFNRQEQRLGFQLPNQNGNFDNLIVSDSGTLIGADVGLNQPQRLDVLQIEEGTDSKTYAIGFNTEATYDGFVLEFDAHYSRSDALINRADYVPQLGSGTLSDLGSFFFDGSNNDVPNVTSTIAVNDPGSVRAHWNQVQTDEIEDELVEFELNGEKIFDGDFLESIEVGAFYTDRTKSLNHSEIPSTVFCTNTCGSGADLDDSIFGVTSVDNFLSSEAGDFPRQFVFIEDFDAYFKAIGDLNGVPNWQVPVLTPRASSVTKEEVYGAYIQANIRTEIGDMPFSGNIGVRIARTSTSASGFSQSIQDVVRATANPAATALITTFNTEAAVTIDNSYWNVLPSLNFVLEMRDDLFLRFAAAQTITRPTISDLSVAESFQTSNIETFSVTSGNPLLTPYKVNQVDIGLEYYGESGDTLSATFFYKGINTFISEATVLEDSGFTLPFTGSLEQARTSQQNRDGGRVLGLELAATHYLDYISALEGFGIQANYTYANASDDNAPQVVLPLVTAASLAVEGFAKHTFNLIGFYDKGPLQLRLAYNWRDTFLLSRQGARSFGLPEHSSSFGQLDFSASYNITDNLVATVEGINITNQRLLRFEDIRERVSLIQYTGRRIRVGVRASF